MTVYDNFEAASEAFSNATACHQQPQEGSGIDQPTGEDSDQEDEDSNHDDNIDQRDSDSDHNAEEEGMEINEDDVEGEGFDENTEDETPVVVTFDAAINEEDQLAEAEFEAQLSKMMTESLTSRQGQRKTAFDVPLPARKVQDQNQDDITKTKDGVVFTVLTKKGTKSSTKTVSLPSDVKFVASTLKEAQAVKTEKEEMKRLVLGYEQRDLEDSRRQSNYNTNRNNNHSVSSWNEKNMHYHDNENYESNNSSMKGQRRVLWNSTGTAGSLYSRRGAGARGGRGTSFSQHRHNGHSKSGYGHYQQLHNNLDDLTDTNG